MRLLKPALIVVFVASAVTAAVIFVPWKTLAQERILSLLSARGINNVAFEIEDLSLDEATLTGISVGRENPLLLDRVTLQFSPRELLDGTLRDLSLTGLHIKLLETDKGWVATGMDVLPKREGGAPLDIPAMLASLPFRSLTVEESMLTVQGKSLSSTLPFRLALSDKVVFETRPAVIAAGKNEISVGPLSAALSFNDAKDRLAGEWSIPSVSFNEEIPVPQLSATGTLSVAASAIDATASFKDKANAYRGALKIMADLAAPDKNAVILTSASFPFKQGRVSTKNVPLKTPVTVPVTISGVSVDELMQALTGKRVTATGTVSGSLPITFKKDGAFVIGRGNFKADKAGRISMPPDVIPGDNEQVALVRKILENLQYSLLAARVTNGKDGRMGVSLSLEGRNPDVYNGRPVKLNINLTGDVLDFVRQNIILFQTPEKLLEQELQ